MGGSDFGFLLRRLLLMDGSPPSAAVLNGVLLIVIPFAERNFLMADSSSKRGGFIGITKVRTALQISL